MTLYTDEELNAGTGKKEGILPGSIQLELCTGGQKINYTAEIDGGE